MGRSMNITSKHILFFVLSVSIFATSVYAQLIPRNPAQLPRTTTTYGVISYGKFYSFSSSPLSAYQDAYPCLGYSDGAKVTDEETNLSGSFEQSDWIGWDVPVSIDMDLGKIYEIDRIDFTLCSNTSANIKVPQSVSISTSTDGQIYSDFGTSIVIPSDSSQFTPSIVVVSDSFTEARFIRFVLTPQENSTALLSELMAYGHIQNSWKNVPDWGCYHGAFPASPEGYMSIGTFENYAGKELSMVLWYHGMGFTLFGALSNLSPLLENDYGGHRYLSIGWLPEETTAEQIAHGDLDSYFQQWFTDSLDRELRNGRSEPIWIRPMNEMNGSWTANPSGKLCYGGDPYNYRQAWRRMYNIAEQLGAADHDIFVWSPDAKGYPQLPWNNMQNYYPGDQYVDWVGLSVYPHSYVTEEEKYPRQCIAEAYGYYGSYKPFIISEGGFSDDVDKVRWVNEWFDCIKNDYPMMKAAIWENHNARRIESSPETLEAYSTQVSDPYFLDSIYAGHVDHNQDQMVNYEDFTFFANGWLEDTSGWQAYFDSFGLIVIEAETYMHLVAGSGQAEGFSWQFMNDNPTALGDGYMQALPNSGLTLVSDIETDAPHLLYNVYFSRAGTYYLWIRSAAADTTSDTVYFGLDSIVQGSMNSRIFFNFSWESNAASITVNAPGLHTFDLWMADDGLKIDRIILVNESDFSSASEPSISSIYTGPTTSTDIDADNLTDIDDLAKLLELWLD
jgi:Glycosyl hydrolase family 26/F5/8 type C domain